MTVPSHKTQELDKTYMFDEAGELRHGMTELVKYGDTTFYYVGNGSKFDGRVVAVSQRPYDEAMPPQISLLSEWDAGFDLLRAYNKSRTVPEDKIARLIITQQLMSDHDIAEIISQEKFDELVPPTRKSSQEYAARVYEQQQDLDNDPEFMDIVDNHKEYGDKESLDALMYYREGDFDDPKINVDKAFEGLENFENAQEDRGVTVFGSEIPEAEVGKPVLNDGTTVDRETLKDEQVGY